MSDPPAPPTGPAGEPLAPVALDPHRLDLHVVYETLRAGKGTDVWLSGFLPSTYAKPERFREALYAYVASRRSRGVLKSRPAVGFDLYHDCVLAHVGHRRAALVVRESGATIELSFESLHQRCSALMAAWTREGVAAGDSIAIVLPLGVDYALAVLTALRIGLVVSVVAPIGATFVRHRLEVLGPDHVASADKYRRMVGAFATKQLAGSASPHESGASAGSHSYAPDEVALRCLSPFGADDVSPYELGAGELHQSLLRDGLLVHCLDATDRLAAPGFDPMQFQPHLLLTTLMAGATYAECTVGEIESDPKVLDRLRVTVLGISRAVRELLLQRGPAAFKPTERAWFRSLTEVLEIDRWDELGRVLTEKNLLGFNVMVNAASCGAHLFSPRGHKTPTLRIWPVPGQTWQLSQVAGGMLPTLTEAGVYTALQGEVADASLPRMMVSRLGEGYVYAGAMEPGPNAQAYPADEIATLVETHPGVRHAAVVLAPGRWINDAKVVLLVFVDGKGESGSEDAPIQIPDLKALIAREMGDRYRMDRIEVFPLRPRHTKTGEVDRAWCRAQYLSGALTRKSRSEIFVALSQICYIFAGEEKPE